MFNEKKILRHALYLTFVGFGAL